MTVLNSPGAPVRTLSPEDTLIHLCLHVLAHIDHDHGWQLRHLCDISRHVAVFAIDWTAYGERTRALGVEAGCAAVLALSHLTAGAVVPEEYQDRLRGIQLLTHAIPGPTQHRLLAIFLKAIASGHVRQAVSMVYRSMVDGSQMGEDDTVRIRPRRSLSIVARIAREMVQHPSRMIRQLHVWIPWAEKQKDRERLLVELLPPR